MKKLSVKKLRSNKRFHKVLWPAAFVVIGLVTLLLARAAVVTATLEPELGTRTPRAVLALDQAASGGQSVQFTQAGSSGLPFTASFETSADFALFQTEVHHGVDPTSYPNPFAQFAADHNTVCDGPTTTRILDIGNYPSMTYWCAAKGTDTGHIHTAMRTGGFALVSFSPNQAFTGIHKICWDISQQDIGGRRFPQVAVIPETIYQANGKRLDYVDGTNDIGENSSITITGEAFMLTMLRGSTSTHLGTGGGQSDFSGFVNGTDKLRRFKNCMTDNENGTLSFSLERATGTDTRTLAGSFPNGAARVIFADHNYNPPKDPGPTPDPNTLHWDNISIQ